MTTIYKNEPCLVRGHFVFPRILGFADAQRLYHFPDVTISEEPVNGDALELTTIFRPSDDGVRSVSVMVKGLAS